MEIHNVMYNQNDSYVILTTSNRYARKGTKIEYNLFLSRRFYLIFFFFVSATVFRSRMKIRLLLVERTVIEIHRI